MPQDQHVGVSPGIAKSLAEALSVPLQLVPFPGPGSYLSPCVFLEREKVNYEQEKNTSEKIVITAALLPSLLLILVDLDHLYLNIKYNNLLRYYNYFSIHQSIIQD